MEVYREVKANVLLSKASYFFLFPVVNVVGLVVERFAFGGNSLFNFCGPRTREPHSRFGFFFTAELNQLKIVLFRFGHGQ